MRLTDIPETEQLSTPEKILLLEDLWDGIASDESNLTVPHDHKDELDRRLEPGFCVWDKKVASKMQIALFYVP